MKTKDLLAKADISLSDLASGGLMQPEQQNRFIRILTEDTNFLQDVRTVPMARPKMNINKLDLATRALRLANQGTISSPLTGEEGTRALARADRVKVTTTKVELDTFETIAEVNIPYEVIEDNIEGGNIDNSQFQATVLQKLAERVRVDVEDHILNADTGSGDAFLAVRDGVIASSTSNIVNNGGAPIDAVLFNDMLQQIPDKFKRLMPRYKFYVAHNQAIQYMMQVAQRQTGLGDSVLVGGSAANFSPFGVPMVGCAQMPSDKALLIDPNNVIFGVQRNMRLEMDTDVRERVLIFVLTLRYDFKLEQEDMVVKATNIGS